ncbi:MAG: hypothetical protein QOJ63_859 [Solirubrobacteraceae bacterium]|nr:hypothetical protein [Solirubrobacteraceae bacterium]
MIARRLKAESGFVLPGAIALLAIFVSLTATALTFSLQSLDNTNRDRRVVRALQAADAGADIAIFRLNHMLVASATGATLGLAVNAAESLGCTSVVAGNATIVAPTAQYCPAISGSSTDVHDATYSYMVSSAVSILSGALLTRKILATGTSRGVTRRVLVKVQLVVNGAGSLVLYQRVRHTECTSVPPDPSSPDSGCPGADIAQ